MRIPWKFLTLEKKNLKDVSEGFQDVSFSYCWRGREVLLLLTDGSNAEEEAALGGIVVGRFAPSLTLWRGNSLFDCVRLVLEIKFDRLKLLCIRLMRHE